MGDLAITGAKNLEIDSCGCPPAGHLTLGARILVAGLQLLLFPPLKVLLRSISLFPVYSLASAVDGGKGGGEGASEDCNNAGASLGRFLSTKERVRLRPGGVPGHLRESGTITIG